MQSRYYHSEIGRFINADTFTATGQGLLGNNMFTYCCNNPIFYSDSSGTRCVAAFKAEMSGGKKQSTPAPTPPSPPDVGDGNYYNFEKDDLFSQHTSELLDISREQANAIYHEIEQGDYGYMPKLPIISSILGQFSGEIWDAISLAFDISSSMDGMMYSQTYDPAGRLLYVEEGYSAVIIDRVYIGNGYSATEREYFLFDQDMQLQYNDTIIINRFVD